MTRRTVRTPGANPAATEPVAPAADPQVSEDAPVADDPMIAVETKLDALQDAIAQRDAQIAKLQSLCESLPTARASVPPAPGDAPGRDAAPTMTPEEALAEANRRGRAVLSAQGWVCPRPARDPRNPIPVTAR